MHHHHTLRSHLFAIVLVAALLAAACAGGDQAPQPAPAPAGDTGPPTPAEPADPAPPSTTPEPEPDPPPAPDPAIDDQPADDAVREPETTDPALDEPEAPADPWGDRRRDLLIELTDPADTELLAEFGRIVGERRGLELIEEVPVYLIRRADLGAYFASLYTDPDVEEAEFEEAILRLLGVIEPELDYRGLLEDLFTGVVLGLYDEDVDVFIIVSDNDHISRRDLDTIAHEFVHALQDQHFNLDTGLDEVTSTDAATAFRFLIEGDARLSERLFRDVIQEFAPRLEGTRDRLPGALSVPAGLRRIFNAPYVEGRDAVSRIVAAGETPNAIDAYLAQPPPTTEQVLHPDKLATAEPPIAVADPDVGAALGAGWELLGNDTLGEFILRATLERGLGQWAAAQASTGWGGDRLSIYAGPAGAELLVWRLAWDDADEAREFDQNAEPWMRFTYGGSGATSGDAYAVSGGRAAAWLLTEERQSWLIVSSDAAALDRAAEAVRAQIRVAALGLDCDPDRMAEVTASQQMDGAIVAETPCFMSRDEAG